MHRFDFLSYVAVLSSLIFGFPIIILWIVDRFLRSKTKTPQTLIEACLGKCSKPFVLLVSLWISFLFVRIAEYPAELRGVDIKSATTFCLETVMYICLVWLYSSIVDAVFQWMKGQIPHSGFEETFDTLAGYASILLKALGFAIVFIIYLGLTSLFFSEEAATFRKAIASVVVGSIVLATVFLRQIAISYLYLTYIIWEGHFSIGDEIIVYERDQGTARGIVSAVDAYFTHLVGADGTVCLVPNLHVVKGMLTRISASAPLCLEVPCAVHYKATSAQIESFMAAAKKAAALILDRPGAPSDSESPWLGGAGAGVVAVRAGWDARVRLVDDPMQQGGIGLAVRCGFRAARVRD